MNMKKDLISVGEYAVKVVLVFGIIYLIYDIFYIFMPVILAIFISLVLKPPVNKLKTKKIFGRKMPESIAIIIVLSTCMLMFSIILLFFVRPLLSEVSNLMLVLPDMFKTIQRTSISWMEKMELWNLPHNMQSILEKVMATASNYIISFMQGMIQTAFSFASNILGIIVLPFLVYYFLKDGHKFSASLIKYLPKIWIPKARLILKESAYTISAYVRGTIIVGLIGGCVIGVGTYIIGLDYPFVFAVLAALAEAVPFVGTILSIIPAMFLGLLKGTDTFIAVAVFYTAYHLIDAYILAPRITGKYLKMHPVIIIISILIGGKTVGVMGMIFAVPAVALVRILLKHIVIQQQEDGANDRTTG